MMHRATGSFDVILKPLEIGAIAVEVGLARMSLEKRFEGGLEAISRGEMLTTSSETTGAMAYVALERIAGTLNGRHGTFVLIHKATMLKREPASAAMAITIVPGSGTEDLAGIQGALAIFVEAGKHICALDYELPTKDEQ